MGYRDTGGNMVEGCFVKIKQTLKKVVFSPCEKKKKSLALVEVLVNSK